MAPKYARRASLAAIATLAAAVAVPAQATIISHTYQVTASGFTPSGAPVDPFSFEFSISFDDSVSTEQSSGLSVISSNFAYDGSVKYLFGSGYLYVGAADSVSQSAGNQKNDFTLVITGVDSTPSVTSVSLTKSSDNTTLYTAVTTALVVDPQSATAAPEPATLAVLGFGAAALIGARRRRAAAC